MQYIYSNELQNQYRMNDKDFTRNRKLKFPKILLFLMNRITKTLSIEIDNIIGVFNKDKKLKTDDHFTKSAFVQSRKKIDYKVFDVLSKKLTDEFYTDNTYKKWHKFRVLAVDGSLLTLPNTKELMEVFGSNQPHTKEPIIQGRVSLLYDVLNGFVIDSTLQPLSRTERDLAIDHIKHATPGDLILYDRGYPSFDMMYQHKKRDIDFLFRVQTNFNKETKEFLNSTDKTKLIELSPSITCLKEKGYTGDETIIVRMNKVVLPNGTVEILISSLLDKDEYRNNIFKDLYFKRWNVEIFYNELKNKLKVGNFSGNSEQVILQDFYSTIFVSNIQTLLIEEINDELKEQKGTKKYNYKVNNNVSYGILKNRIIEIFFTEQEMSKTIFQIKELLKKHTIPIRPNRKNERDTRKFDNRKRPKTLTNQRDAI
ncbi:IS4 family transposase [Halosquirtibacter laminarini]|uniref:IS4 family transposase n=6 Tax=Halosquirtibacter laminarini TaxID=3374600 RepID=A0AC61NBH5_9BACT|nr:IS4 family transposase [Prolixibacteraceae bacterium]QZE12821.1 IS4 family transposase [Prolixibacteraceae bacterium]QZE12859.1 IS4 family transposase [Prolixibacteraceae bacterium]QZE14393.1 IS4 family transposase [Prolixibacteraceae bacterium]QZE15859.1 IS4 family transposase [Prolixibacteraceae bacterium]